MSKRTIPIEEIREHNRLSAERKKPQVDRAGAIDAMRRMAVGIVASRPESQPLVEEPVAETPASAPTPAPAERNTAVSSVVLQPQKVKYSVIKDKETAVKPAWSAGYETDKEKAKRKKVLDAIHGIAAKSKSLREIATPEVEVANTAPNDSKSPDDADLVGGVYDDSAARAAELERLIAEQAADLELDKVRSDHRTDNRTAREQVERDYEGGLAISRLDGRIQDVSHGDDEDSTSRLPFGMHYTNKP